MEQHRARRGVLSRKIGIPLAVVALLSLGVGSPGLANLPSSAFESDDGNLVVNTAGNTDWANAPALQVKPDKPSGGTDDALGQGAKEDIPNPTVVSGSIPPNKSDLSRFYVSHENTGGSFFLYLAWERTNVLGSANVDFEFNQSQTLGGNGVTPLRTAGDMLITFDFTNGGGNPVLGLLRWVTTGPASQCFSSNALPCWGNRVDLSAAGFADGAVNAVSVVDPINPGAPRTLPALTFGEAAVNLSAANIFPAGQCVNFATAFLKSRSSASFPAELKDFIAPANAQITNCGTVNIHKVDDLGAALQGAVFTLFTDNAPKASDGQPSHGPEDTATALSCTTASNGDCSIPQVPFGDDWAVETTGVPNHDLAADQAVHLDANTPNLTVSLTFVDPRQTGAIQVTKTRKHAADGPGDHPQSGVDFTVNGVTRTTDADGVACFDGLAFGTYTVHETVPAGYHVDGNDKSVTVDNTTTCAGSPFAGETVSFHNTPLTDISASVNSQVDGATASTIVCRDGNGTIVAAGSTGATGDGSTSAGDLEPGTYTCTLVIDP
jgi:hypothetical protein